MSITFEATVENGQIKVCQPIALADGTAVRVTLTPVHPHDPTVQSVEANSPRPAQEGSGWPPGYFENTFGSITDETFVRHP